VDIKRAGKRAGDRIRNAVVKLRGPQRTKDRAIRRGRWTAGLMIVALGVITAIAVWGAPNPNGQKCRQGITADLDPGAAPSWRLVRPAGKKVTIALDDSKDRGRFARGSVLVQRIKRKGRPVGRALPATTKVGAFVRGNGFAKEDRSLQFTPAVSGRRQPDGTLVAFTVCARRPSDLGDNQAGVYRGAVRVAGKGVAGVNVPVEITIKRDRRIAIIAAIVVALAGTLAAAGNSKSADVEPRWVKQNRGMHELFWALPMVASVVAGAAAGSFVYFADATWGDDLTADATKLAVAALAGGAAAVTALAPLGRSARRKTATRSEAAEVAAKKVTAAQKVNAAQKEQVKKDAVAAAAARAKNGGPASDGAASGKRVSDGSKHKKAQQRKQSRPADSPGE
jgi:hypothetical protein